MCFYYIVVHVFIYTCVSYKNIYVWVCAIASKHIAKSISTFIYLSISIYTYGFILGYVCVVRVYIRNCEYVIYLHLHLYIYGYQPIRMGSFVYMCLCVRMYVYIFVYVCIFVYLLVCFCAAV